MVDIYSTDSYTDMAGKSETFVKTSSRIQTRNPEAVSRTGEKFVLVVFG